MCCWITAIEDQTLSMVDVFIYPFPPSSHGSLKRFSCIKLWINNAVFFVVVLPDWWWMIKVCNWLRHRERDGETMWLPEVRKQEFAYPLAVFPCVHQWPVLKTRMSAFFHRLADLSTRSISRIGFLPPCPFTRIPCRARKWDWMNSTVQL